MEWVCFIFIIFPFAVVYADYQVDALNAFRNGLSDTGSVIQSWVGDDPCTWSHVTCDGDRVIKVDLGNAGLAGPLAPDLGNLTALQEVFNNKINGSIPRELGNLTSLVSLDLFGNSLTGSIPQELGKLKNLKVLGLNDNNLSGPIPGALRYMPYLQVFDIWGNPGLCGPLTNNPCPP